MRSRLSRAKDRTGLLGLGEIDCPVSGNEVNCIATDQAKAQARGYEKIHVAAEI